MQPRTRKRIWRTSAAVAVVLLLPFVLVALLLVLRPARDHVLSLGLAHLRDNLPGELTVDHADWPSPGSLSLRGVLWTVDGDTLVHLDTLRAAVDLEALWDRDLVVRDAAAAGALLDIPRIQALFPADEGAEAGGGDGGRPFLRSGALPPVPSVAVTRASIVLETVRWSEAQRVQGLSLDAGLELRRDHEPELRLDLAARDGRGAWSVDDLLLTWAPARGEITGSGQGFAAPDVPVTLRLTGKSAEDFELTLTGAAAAGPAPYLTVHGALGEEDGRRAVDLDGRFLTPGTTDLAALPSLAAALASAPDLAGLDGGFRSRIVWRDDRPVGELAVDLRADRWCDQGRIAVRVGPETAHLDTLSLTGLGLTVAASGEATAEQLDLRARLLVRGSEWQRLLQPDATPLDSLAVDIGLRATGAPASPALTVDLVAGLRAGEVRIDRAVAHADVEAGAARATLDWSLRAFDMSAAGAAEVTRDADEVAVRTSPLLVAMGPAAAPPSGSRRGVVRWRTDGSGLRAEAVRLTGALGDAVLDADLGRDDGTVHLAATWPHPPRILERFLEPPHMDTLRSVWSDADPWLVDLGLELSDIRAPMPAADAAMTFRLPGPHRFAFALPPALHTEDLGPIEGSLRAASRRGRTRLDLDLEPTSWIDRGAATVRAIADSLVLESLDFAALGLALTASGEADADQLTARAELSLPDATILRRFEGLPADIDGRADVHLTAAGPRLRPRIDAELSAAVAGPEFAAPAITGSFGFDGDDLDLSLALPEGLAFGTTRLDTLTAALRGPLPGEGEERIALRVVGARGSLGLGAALSFDEAETPTWTVTGDTLFLRADGEGLDLIRPFRLDFAPASGRLKLSDLALAGALGTLDVDAHRDSISSWAGGLRGTVAADLRLPPTLFPPTLPEALRPASVVGAARLDDTGVELDLKAFGLSLGARSDIAATVRAGFDGVRAEDARFRIHAAVVDGADTLAVAVADLPGDTAVRMSDGKAVPLSAHLDLRDCPLPPTPGSPLAAGHEVLVSGSADLGGTTAAPTAAVTAAVTATGWPELVDHRLDLSASLLQAGEGGFARGALTADFALMRGTTRLARGDLQAPGGASLQPLGFTPDDERPLSANLVSDGLKLEEFAALLPAAVGLQGRIDMSLKAEGASRNPNLAGDLKLSQVRASLPDGSWLTLQGDARLAGTWLRPKLTGACELTGGVLRLPDPPRTLHPASGDPLLWRVAGISIETPAVEEEQDPEAAVSAAPALPHGGDPASVPDPSVDVRLSIPSGLWLRGQGLEVALSGELDLRSSGGRHDVLGDLAATRGFYRFLGRTFTVEKGEVAFDGGDGTDPALDFSLVTTLEGILYRIAFGGRLTAPRMTLTSNPEMPEGDIMAMLLFGRPLDELSSDQEGLVQDRAVDLVTAYGTAQLEANLSRQLKVDMVTLRRGGGDERGDALVIGKYLHQKVLLKYEQALDGWASFFVNMEYFISHHLKLETSVSRHSQSAAGLNWSVEY